eukprot:SAG31_NODE_2167_length_6269_cov_4.097731_6_plen_358_part_00
MGIHSFVCKRCGEHAQFDFTMDCILCCETVSEFEPPSHWPTAEIRSKSWAALTPVEQKTMAALAGEDLESLANRWPTIREAVKARTMTDTLAESLYGDPWDRPGWQAELTRKLKEKIETVVSRLPGGHNNCNLSELEVEDLNGEENEAEKFALLTKALCTASPFLRVMATKAQAERVARGGIEISGLPANLAEFNELYVLTGQVTAGGYPCFVSDGGHHLFHDPEHDTWNLSPDPFDPNDPGCFAHVAATTGQIPTGTCSWKFILSGGSDGRWGEAEVTAREVDVVAVAREMTLHAAVPAAREQRSKHAPTKATPPAIEASLAVDAAGERASEMSMTCHVRADQSMKSAARDCEAVF